MANYSEREGATGKKYTVYSDRIKVTYRDGSSRTVRPTDVSYQATKDAMEKDIADKKWYKPGKSTTTATNALGAGKTDGLVSAVGKPTVDTALKNEQAILDRTKSMANLESKVLFNNNMQNAQNAVAKVQAQQVQPLTFAEKQRQSSMQNLEHMVGRNQLLNDGGAKTPLLKAVTPQTTMNRVMGVIPEQLNNQPVSNMDVAKHTLESIVQGVKNSAIQTGQAIGQYSFQDADAYRMARTGNPALVNALSNPQQTDALAEGFAQDRIETAQQYADKMQEINEKYNADNFNTAQQMVGQVGTAVGQIAPAMLLGPAYLLPYMYGMSANQALGEGATIEQADDFAVLNTAKEFLIEMLVGGVPVGKMKSFIEPEKIMAKFNIDFGTANKVASRLFKALGEGGEEVLAGMAEPYLQRHTYNPDAEILDPINNPEHLEELAWQFLIGAGAGGVFQGIDAANSRLRNRNQRETQQIIQNAMQNVQNQQNLQAENAESIQKPQNASESPVVADVIKNITTPNKVAENQSSQADISQNVVENVLKQNQVENQPKVEAELPKVEEIQPVVEQTETIQADNFDINELPEETRTFYNDMSKKFGNIKLSRNLADNVPGVYKNGEVILNANKLDDVETITYATIHEFGHKMKGTAEYDQISNLALRYFRSIANDPEVTDMDLVDYIVGTREGSGFEITSETEAFDELTTMFMEFAFDDANTIDYICKEQPSFARSVVQFIEQKIRDYKAKKGMTKLERQQYDMLSKARQLYIKGLQKTTRRDALLKDDSAKSDNPEIRYSVNSVRNDINEGKMYNDLIEFGIMTRSEADEFIANLTELADNVASLGSLFLDSFESYGKEDRATLPFKDNSDPLYKVSLDFSTLCKKRVITQAVIEKIQMEKGRVLSAEEQIAIRDYLKELKKTNDKIEVACAMCYVEAARLRTPKYLQQFIDNPVPIVEKYLGTKNPANKDAIKAAGGAKAKELGYPEDSKLKDIKAQSVADWREVKGARDAVKDSYRSTSPKEVAILDFLRNEFKPEMVLTANGMMKLKGDQPEVYTALNAFLAGKTKAKALQTSEPYYYGDSSYVSDGLIKQMNEENGLRHNSWSDFEIIHLLDMIVATADLSVRKSKMQFYSKVIAEFYVMKDTNAMANISMIPLGKTGFDENGNLAFDDVEGVPLDKALKVREDCSETAGTIAIGINDKHIKALLDADYIDYVIPYHTSGLSKLLRKMVGIDGWDDYQDFQNELNASGKKASNAPKFSEWFNPTPEDIATKDGLTIMREAQEKYLKLCKERGIKPKFSNSKNGTDFTTHPNYWKLLIDRKMINNDGKIIIQKEVVPKFDFDYLTELVVHEYDNSPEQSIKASLEAVKDLGEAELQERANALKKDGSKVSYNIGYDSNGRELTPEQAEYFKDSKVRDSQGNLLPVYHSTDSFGFNEFDGSKAKSGFFFTSDKEMSQTYTSSRDKTYETYLNIKNPMIVDAKGSNWNDIRTSYSGDPIMSAVEQYVEIAKQYDSAIDKNLILYDSWGDVQGGAEFIIEDSYDLFDDAQKAELRRLAKIIDNAPADWDASEIPKNDVVSTGAIARKAKEQGLDGVIIKNVRDNGSNWRRDGVMHTSDVYIAFSPEQIKNVDNTNPTSDADIRYSTGLDRRDAVEGIKTITKKEDQAYMDAVNRGDMETAQRMVNEAAEKAGYNEEVFHGMTGRYNVYRSGSGQYGDGVYFTYDEGTANSYGHVVDHLFVKVGKIADYDDAYKALGKREDQDLDNFAQALGFTDFDSMVDDWENDPTDVASNPELINLLRNKEFEGFVDEGNDGFVLWDFNGIEYRIKLADAVTYDDDGNVIPLSQRFNPESGDIRYSTGGSASKRIEEIKNIKHGQKVSKVYSNTMMNSPLFNEVEKTLELQEGDYAYDVKSEKESLQKARERLENDHAGTVKELMHKTMYTGEDVDAAMFLLEESIAKARETGNYSHAKAWVKKLADAGTEGGRTVQAFAKYSRTTAEGIATQAQRYVEQSEKALKTDKVLGRELDSAKWRKVEAETEQAEKIVSEAELQAEKKAKDELEKRVAEWKKKHYRTNPNPKAKQEADAGDVLYRRILDNFDPTLEGKGKLGDSQIVSELYAKLKEEGLPDFSGSKKRKHTKLELLRDAVVRKDEYKEVFERTQEYMRRKYGNDPEKLSLITRLLTGNPDGRFEDIELDAMYSTATLEGAIAEVAELYGVDFKEIVKQSGRNKEVAKSDILNHILSYTKAKKEDAEALADSIVRIFDERIAQETESAVDRFKPKPKAEKEEVLAVEKLTELFSLGAYKDERTQEYKERNLDRALKQTAELLNIDMKAMIKESAGDKQQAANALYDHIKKNSDLNEDDANRLAADIVNTYFGELNRLTEQRLKQMFLNEPKPRNKKSAFDELMELINMGAYERQDIVDAIKQKNKLPVLTSEDIQVIQENVEKANQYKRYSYEWKMYMARAQQVASDKMPQVRKDKITQFKRIMMLSGPRTHSRNIVGNVPLSGTEIISDVIGSMVDKGLSGARGTQRTTTANPFVTEFLRGFGSGAVDTAKDIRNNVNTYRMGDESVTQYEMPRGRTFDNSFLNGIDKAISYGLMFGDRTFFEGHYRKRMAQLNKLGYDTTSQEAKAEAYAYAVDMVFQSDSKMAKGARGMREALNNLLTINGFALGDFVIPFVQTPANIADKLLDYSPVGFAKAIGQAMNSKTEAFDQRLFCQRIGRSLTGTAILGASYALAAAGAITGGAPEDAEVRNALYAAGWKPYSFYIDGKYYDYSFIQPVGMLLAMGADAYRERQNAEDLNDLGAILFAGVKGGADCFFNMSFFSNLTDFFGGFGSTAENMASAFMDFPGQFAPAIVNAANKSIDPYQRETYDSDPIKRTINKFIAKTPASQTLPIKQDIYGRDMKQNQGRDVVKRTIENMIFPSTMSERKEDVLNDELLRLHEDTGEAKHLLSYPDKTQNFGGGNEFRLNGEEYVQFTKDANGYAAEQMTKFIESNFYDSLDDAERIDVLHEIEKYATYVAKKKFAESKGVSYTDSKYEDIKKTNIEPAVYFATKKELSKIKGDSKQEEYKLYLQNAVENGNMTDEDAWYWWTENYTAKKYMEKCPYDWIKKLNG